MGGHTYRIPKSFKLHHIVSKLRKNEHILYFLPLKYPQKPSFSPTWWNFTAKTVVLHNMIGKNWQKIQLFQLLQGCNHLKCFCYLCILHKTSALFLFDILLNAVIMYLARFWVSVFHLKNTQREAVFTV